MMSVTDNKESAERSKVILDAALKVFTKVGYHEAKISDIADQAGVAKGTIYLYFAGKKELFVVLMEGIADNHIKTLVKALADVESVEEKLKIIAEKQLSMFKSRHDPTRLNIHEMIVGDSDFQKKMLEFRERYIELIASVLAPAGGDEPQGRLHEAAVAFSGLIHAFNLEIYVGRRDFDLPALAERITAIFLRGYQEGRQTV